MISEFNVVDSMSCTNNFEYDLNGNRTNIKTISSDFVAAIAPIPIANINDITYVYDENNRLTQISNQWGDTFDFSYDQAKRLTSIARPGSVTEFIFSQGSQLAEINHKASGLVKAFSRFTYDQRNFITSKTSVGDALSYNYDLNGQLTATNSQNFASQKNEIFSYDSLGNRTADQNQSYTYTESGQRLTDDGLFTYLFDNNGNILSKSSKANSTSYLFEYSTSNQLKKIMVLDRPLGTLQKTIEFFYDAMGRRFKKQLTDHNNNSNNYIRKYIYDGDNIIAELDDSNRLLASYTHSPLAPDDVLSVHFTNHAVSSTNGGDAINSSSVLSPAIGNYYFLKDQINSITAIANNQGEIVQSYENSSYGKIFEVKNAQGVSSNFQQAQFRTSFTFTGREYEPETGLYYYRARYYDPSVGRFLQQDPDPGKLADPRTFLSKYIYVNNNPIMYSDPSGKFGFLIAMLWTAIGTGAMSYIQAGGLSGDFDWGKFRRYWEINFTVSAIALIGAGAISKGWSLFTDTSIYSWNGFGVHVEGGSFAGGFSLGATTANSGAYSVGTMLHEVGHTLLQYAPAVSNFHEAGIWGYMGVGISSYYLGVLGQNYNWFKYINPVTPIVEGIPDLVPWISGQGAHGLDSYGY